MISLLDHYRQYHRTTKKMLEAAQNGEWERVMSLNQQCQPMISALKTQSLDTSEQEATEEVRVLIGEMIDFYKRISVLGAQQRAELQAELSANSTANKLEKLYRQ